MTQQQNANYLIRQAVFTKSFPTRHGEMNRFDLVVEDAAQQQYECELVQKPQTAPPAEGEVIRGHLEQTQHGLKFRKEYNQQQPQQAPPQPAQSVQGFPAQAPAAPTQVAPGSLTGAPMPPGPVPAAVPSPDFQQAQATAAKKHEDSEAGRIRRWAISVAREYLSDQAKQGSIPGYTLNDLERQAEQFVRMANGESAVNEVPSVAPAHDEAA